MWQCLAKPTSNLLNKLVMACKSTMSSSKSSPFSKPISQYPPLIRYVDVEGKYHPEPIPTASLIKTLQASPIPLTLRFIHESSSDDDDAKNSVNWKCPLYRIVHLRDEFARTQADEKAESLARRTAKMHNEGKELKLSTTISNHDFDNKVTKKACELLEKGYRVNFTISCKQQPRKPAYFQKEAQGEEEKYRQELLKKGQETREKEAMRKRILNALEDAFPKNIREFNSPTLHQNNLIFSVVLLRKQSQQQQQQQVSTSPAS